MNLTNFHHRRDQAGFELPFGIRAASALGISVVADALDYVGAPIFALPVIGDIADVIVTSLLYRITKSKVSVVINAVEFIPFIGDFIPTYTISTLLWILNESRKRNNRQKYGRTDESLTRILKGAKEDITVSNQSDSLRTRITRAYAILRNKSNG
jgi:hypothetical protein